MIETILLEHYKHPTELPLPEGNYDDSAGVDLRAAIQETITLEPGQDTVIPSGLKMHIGSSGKSFMFHDVGMYGCILPRSGLGFKHYLRLANTAGVIDPDYQGEIMIKIRNEGTESLTIERGDRICQMVFHMFFKNIEFIEVDEFTNDSERSSGGFGSSGVK